MNFVIVTSPYTFFGSFEQRLELLESRRMTFSNSRRSDLPDLQTSAKVNTEGIAQTSVSVEGGHNKIPADVTSSVSENVFILEQTYNNISTSNSASTLSLMSDSDLVADDCDMVADDWHYHIN